jgi:hypothetical protein
MNGLGIVRDGDGPKQGQLVWQRTRAEQRIRHEAKLSQAAAHLNEPNARFSLFPNLE